MRKAACLVALLLWPLAALAQGSRPFDPTALGPQDTRFLQAALVWSGDYVGLTDGEWGERSQAGLDAFLARGGAGRGPAGEADLLLLLVPFVEEVVAGGWVTINLDGPLTVALPSAVLARAPADPEAMECRSADDSLVFRVLFDTPQGAQAMHDWMLDAHAAPEAPYHSVRGDRMVTAIALANGKEVYLRTARLGGFTLSMQVINEPWQEARADLIASSMQWGRAPDLIPEPGGALERLLLGPPPPPLPAPPTAAPEPPLVAALPAPPPAPDRGPDPGPNPGPNPGPAAGKTFRPPAAAAPAPPVLPTTGLVATGTGFFVNATDVVTAAHVVRGCRDLRLEDGAPLVLVAEDPALDLAVLASARRSAHWLPLGPAEGPRLGEPVFALGFPFFGSVLTANQGLSVTSGNVSALPRVADAWSRINVSAPVQPGNSGGPLLSAEGAVQGVVVSRADDLATLEVEGVLPQNLNQATSVAQLVPFLEGAGVLFPSAADRPGPDLSRGIPDAVQAAVVLIGCY